LGTENLREKGLQPNRILREQLLKIERCGHSPHKDQAPLVTAAVAKFINSI
jgi:hypothetical protein